MRTVIEGKYTKVVAIDERGEGNANHHYEIRLAFDRISTFPACIIDFQKGPIKDKGLNGVTNEDLLAVVIDRLAGFQAGKFSCRENALALTKVQEALFWLANRTALREARGVEGTNVV